MPLGIAMLSVQSIPPSLARTHSKSLAAFWMRAMSPDQPIAMTAPPPIISSVYWLPRIWRTHFSVRACSTRAMQASNCSWVMLAGSYPRWSAASPIVSRISSR